LVARLLVARRQRLEYRKGLVDKERRPDEGLDYCSNVLTRFFSLAPVPDQRSNEAEPLHGASTLHTRRQRPPALIPQFARHRFIAGGPRLVRHNPEKEANGPIPLAWDARPFLCDAASQG
jgi:hypothetical protein